MDKNRIMPPALIRKAKYFLQYSIEPEEIGTTNHIAYDISYNTNNKWMLDFYGRYLGTYDSFNIAYSMMIDHHYRLIRNNIKCEDIEGDMVPTSPNNLSQ